MYKEKKDPADNKSKTAALLCCAPTVYANASEQKTALVDEEETLEYDSNRIYVSGTTGWVIENNHWCYYINGVKQTGSLYTQEGEYLPDPFFLCTFH